MTVRVKDGRARSILAAATALAVTGCTTIGDSPTTPAGPTIPSAAPPGPVVVATPLRDRVDLQCADAQGGLNPVPPRHHGVATLLFGEPDSAAFEAQPAIRLGDREYRRLKSEIYTLRESSERTYLTLVAPETALLSYTNWTTWAGSPRDPVEGLNQAIARASTSISVPRCGDDVHGWPGEILLDGPACVVLQLAGENPDWAETITLAKGTEDGC